MRLSLSLLALAACTEASSLQAPPPGCSPGAAAHIQGVPYTTIPDALAAVGAGETIWICAGRHTPGVMVANLPADVTIRGETGDPADVVIDGQGRGLFHLVAPPGSLTTVQDLSIEDGGCLACPSEYALSVSALRADVVLRNLVVRATSSYATVVGASGSRVYVTDLEMSDIETAYGYAVGLSANTYAAGDVVVERSSFRRFSTWDTPVDISAGGPNTPPHITLRDVVFEDNHSENGDSALRVFSDGPSPVVRLEGAAFRRNRSERLHAFGYYGRENGPARLGFRDVLFEDNTGGDAPAIGLFTQYQPELQRLALNRVQFYRNFSDAPGWGMLDEVSWRVSYNDVDFGVGADDNGKDLTRCATNLGAGVSGRTFIPGHDFCP